MSNIEPLNSYLGSKRIKGTNQTNAYSDIKKKDQTKYLKYVLKLSEEEYKMNQKNIIIDKINTYQDFSANPELKASEIDFLEFSKFIDSSWNEDSDFGLLKIKPPVKFVENMKQNYISKMDNLFTNVDVEKRITFRIQKLKDLYKAEVMYFKVYFLFLIYNTQLFKSLCFINLIIAI